MAEIAVNLLMENLEQLMNCKIDLILKEKDQINCLYVALGFLRTFVKDREEKFHEHEELKNLEARIRDVAFEAENTIDLFIVDATMAEKIFHDLDSVMLKTKQKKEIGMAEKIGIVFDCVLNLYHVKREIDAIRTEVMEIYTQKIYDMGAVQVGNSSNEDSPRADTLSWDDEIMVGFEDEAMIIKEQLTRGAKQLEVISIVGMPGLGKTTLAKKVYNDPLVVYHFYIRAWIYVSQEYRKRDLLLRLLTSIIEPTNGLDQMSDDKLAEKLNKGLRGRIYLIVMDDIWDSRTWLDLKHYFPNDNNGSRILFTSRLAGVNLHAKPSSRTLPLSFLTDDESWDLLQQKVFQREARPPELMEIGKKIAKKCKGLPLAIVVVAGILANEEKSKGRWKQVGKTIDSGLYGDPQLWMKTVALSYNHLPHHLKPCFLYFGAFPEVFQIPVRKLIWLWIAEGFIQKSGEKSLEDVAEEYLMDLIGRSLVIISKRGYDGGIKACGIHHLLRDFCLRKAEEDYFLKQISDHQHFSPSPYASNHFSGMRRLCINPAVLQKTSFIPFSLNTRSFLCIASEDIGLSSPEFLFRCFKLLRVLDIYCMNMNRYPREIEGLVLLRYLALGSLYLSSETNLPDSISNLCNLETLILHTSSSVTLPHCIRKMAKLRHLRLSGVWIHKIERGGYPFSLDNLQTLSLVDPWSCLDLLAGTPNLRQLGFRGHMDNGQCLTFPDLDFLNHLQELELCNIAVNSIGSSNNLGRIKLPANLKKLTLKQTRLKWDEMSTLGKLLPNLEWLKLSVGACSGQLWETSDGDFPRLKSLKLKFLDIVRWNASINPFPCLQRLVLVGCQGLERIPSEIGEIPTLERIEVHKCCVSAANSARQIKEEQNYMGNYWLKINLSDDDCGSE